MAFDTVQIVDQAREEAEERLLRECGLILMLAGENQDKYREDLLEIMYFGLIIVNTRSIAVILDYVDDES